MKNLKDVENTSLKIPEWRMVDDEEMLLSLFFYAISLVKKIEKATDDKWGDESWRFCGCYFSNENKFALVLTDHEHKTTFGYIVTDIERGPELHGPEMPDPKYAENISFIKSYAPMFTTNQKIESWINTQYPPEFSRDNFLKHAIGKHDATFAANEQMHEAITACKKRIRPYINSAIESFYSSDTNPKILISVKAVLHAGKRKEKLEIMFCDAGGKLISKKNYVVKRSDPFVEDSPQDTPFKLRIIFSNREVKAEMGDLD